VPSNKYRLGRECTFSVGGTTLTSVRDVAVRWVTSEVDGTGFGHSARSSVVTHRTWEIDIEVLSVTDANLLGTAISNESRVLVATTNGLATLSTYFRIHETTADEPLNDAVVATFTLKQWGHAT